MKYIDVHGHLNFPEYDLDRPLAIERAREKGVGMITVGTDLATSKSAVELALGTTDSWATVGLHPVIGNAKDNGQKDSFNYETFKDFAQHPRVVAIGECGLDFFHCEADDLPRQEQVFIEQISLANELGKPLMLHIRNASDKIVAPSAYERALELLRRYARVKANFHFFAGSLEELKGILDLGCSISVTGVITFARDYDEIIKYVPIDRIMTETDCPYVAPIPHRGKRNEPAHVIHVVQAISGIRGGQPEDIGKRLLENAQNFFGIKANFS